MHPLQTHYSFIWVTVSVLIAPASSVAALFLSDGIREAPSAWLRRFWLTTGSVALGLGIWAMHFLGMLAVTLPLPIFYFWPTVVASLLLAVAASGIALQTVAMHRPSPSRLLAGGVLIGGGISAMHYTGMAAMRSAATGHYRLPFVMLSIVAAIGVSTLAMWLASRTDRSRNKISTKTEEGIVLGVGIAAMHYLAMAGVTFTQDKISIMPGGDLMHVDDLGRVLITVGVGLVIALAFCMATLDMWRHRQLRRAQVALEEKDALLVDQEKLREVNSLLSELSIRDSLTGLYNRRYFDAALQTEWNRASRNGEKMSLMMMDLDCFKALNDHYGHPAGDACLRDVASCLSEHRRRSYDVLARYGGEEFVCLLPGADEQSAKEIAETLRCAVEGLALLNEHSRVSNVLTISIGVVSIWDYASATLETFIQQADEALYEAKRMGSNCVHAVSTSGVSSSASEEVTSE